MAFGWIGAVAAAWMLLAVSPVTSLDLASLSVGRTAAGIPRKPGRPLVIVAFTSPCFRCTQLMPQVLADYRRFKNRVDFLGVNYVDSREDAADTATNYYIPFPVVRTYRSPYGSIDRSPDEDFPAGSIHFYEGVSWLNLTGMLAELEREPLAPAVMARLENVRAFCNSHADAQCIAYAAARDVEFPTAEGAIQNDLPRLFLVDAEGIVRADVGGYKATGSAIAAALLRLGIK
jgi:thiol-disulfide isomerase/thioredoxin